MRRRAALHSLPLLAAFLPVLPLAAQAPADTTRRDTTVFRVGEIVVQAARPVTTTGGSSAIEVRIDSMGLPPAPTLEQVLRELPTVHLRTNSRGESEIAIRGSESRQVALLVDGVPLTLGWDARTDVSVIPATAPRYISVIRGLSSVLYGPNVLGGIIEVGIGHGAGMAARRAEVGFGIDEVGGYSMSATATTPHETGRGVLLLRGGAGFRDSPGMPLAGDVREPVAADDDLRLNTDARQVDGFVAARHEWDSGRWLSMAASGYSGSRGIAAELGVDQPRLWRYPAVARLIGVLSGGTGEVTSPFGGVGDLEASFGLDLGRTEIDQYATRAYDEIVGEEDGDDRTLTLRLRADQTLGGSGALHSALTYADVSHDEQLDGAAAATYRQRLWSAGSELVWRVPPPLAALENVRFSIGAAIDGADTPESGDKPALERLTDWGARAGASATFAEGHAVAHAGVSRRARFPALRELYSGALGRFEPNPDLRPETLVAAEAGVTTRVGKGELQLVGFTHRLSDAIVRISTPERRFKRVNQNRVRSYGIELIAGGTVGPLSLAADLTLQDVQLDDPLNPQQSRPEHQPNIFGSAQLNAPLPGDIRVGVGARHTGEQFCIDPQTGADRELAAGTRFHADAGREWRLRRAGGWFSRLEARIAVDNLADETTYDLCALPQPGRLARFQLRLF